MRRQIISDDESVGASFAVFNKVKETVRMCISADMCVR